MPGEVDKLQVKIEADAQQAFKNVDALVGRLRELARMTGTVAYAMGRVGNGFSSFKLNGEQAQQVTNKITYNFRTIVKSSDDTKQSVDRTSQSMNRLKDYAKIAGAGLSVLHGAAKVVKAGLNGISTIAHKTASALKSVGGAISSLAGAGFGALSGALKGTVGRLTGFFKGIVRIAKYRAIRAAIRAITSGLKEGSENLYAFSQSVGSEFAPAMDKLATAFLYLKNGFAAMFSPLVEYFAPYIDQFIDAIVEAFNWVQRLFAQLTGKSTWNKAIRVQTQWKDNTDDAADSVKKLRQEIQLMDFDELNNITENTDTGSNKKKGDDNKPDPTKMFTIEETGLEPMDGTIWENIKKKFIEWLSKNGLWDENGFNWNALGHKFGEAINWLWEKISTWWNGIDWGYIFGSIINFLDGLTDELGLPDWISDGEFNWGEIGGDIGGAIGEWLAKQDWEGIWNGIKSTVEAILTFTDNFVTEFIRAVFPEGAVDENNNVNWRFVGETIGSKIGEWLKSIDWEGLFHTIIDILTDIYDFLSGLIDGLLDELIPGRKEAREQAERDAEAARTAHNNTDLIREMTGDGTNMGGAGHGFGGDDVGSAFGDPNSFAKTVEEINEKLRKLIPARRALESQVMAMFTRSDGSFNEEEYAGAMALWNNRNGTLAQQKLFWDTYENSATFRAFADLQIEIENTDKLINGLTKDRQIAASKALVAMRKEASSFEVVAAAAEASGSRIYDYFTKLSETLPPYVSLLTADAITKFEKADWAGGGDRAMAKLENALKNAGIDDATIEIAKQSAMAFATEKGWATSGYNTANKIKDAVSKSRIPDKYSQASRDAIGAYITGADWENGGQITVNGLQKAIKNSGPLVNTYSTAASRAIYGYLTGTYNGTGWSDAADETIRKMLMGADLKVIPPKYLNAARDALTAYVAGIDWKRGGNASAKDIMTALVNAGVPESYAKEASKSAARWINSQDWKNSGITSGQNLARGVNTGLSGVRINPMSATITVGTTTEYLGKVANNRIGAVKVNPMSVPVTIPTTQQDISNNINGKVHNVKVDPITIPVNFQHGRIRINTQDQWGNNTNTRTLTYASGGYPQVGTMFVAGEAGAEFVGNINGRTGVASGQEITGIGDAVWSTGNTTATLLEELIGVVRDKNLTLSPSAALGRTVAQSQRLYARQTG